ncbi:kinase [Alteraurantiacibacter buctensis]|uniref:Kinase n=1 Tax=Alteraurantiacibacter buctensis TaxID=1503981 RepID=A0A844YZX7_9SPHN|nr:kinase [Alteraurantiacibacter buctensis]MXO72014.1 kinase [Alteraurantiacibacter buctensis]
MNDDPVAALIAQHRLPGTYRMVVDRYWRPLADEIARQTDRKNPVIVGINGAQGSGKSTLCAFLEVLLDEHGLKAATLSLDDLYLGKADRQRLAEQVHPLFATRGVPGTHAPARGLAIFDDLAAGRNLALPRFDKGTDEPLNVTERIEGPVDVLLFEGWCVGCPPQADMDLLQPVNRLEQGEDSDGVWRSVANIWLKGDYAALFARLDLLVMLAVDGFDAVLANRQRQEDRLRATRPDAPGLMDQAALARFCQHYERLTRHMLAALPDQADIVFRIGPDQTPHGPVKGLASG